MKSVYKSAHSYSLIDTFVVRCIDIIIIKPGDLIADFMTQSVPFKFGDKS